MDELISDFLTETSEGIALLDTELVKLEQTPDDPNLLSNIFRVMHTIKGTCGFLGLPRLEAVAHAGENILGKIRDGELVATPEIISLILSSIDAIKSILAHLESTETEPAGDDKELIDKINQAATGQGDIPLTPPDEPNNHPSAVLTDQLEVPSLEEVTPVPVLETASEELVNSENFKNATAEQMEEHASSPSSSPIITDSTSSQKESSSASPKVDAKDSSKTNTTQSIRVNLDVLEGLMQMVSELVLTRNQLLQMVRAQKDSEFTTPLQRLSHITSELQERVMKTRMQPIGNAWGQFPRLIRDLSLELGKKIELRMIGEDTELDRQLIESIKDPLTHMVRNSADHGLETIEERKLAGKRETGIITLKAYHQGGHIIIEISDDGRGLNIQKIKSKIIANKLASESELEAMTDQQIQQYIFKAGFSTAEKVTSISGRGVGMDVVKTNIEKISGTIELRSTQGKGSSFLIKIPLTLAIMPVLIVECQGHKFGIPQINILEMLKTGPKSNHTIEMISNSPVLRLRESLLPLISLSEILQLQQPSKNDLCHQDAFIVACEVGGYNFGVIVDKIFDTEEIVVKPVAPVLRAIDLYSGSTLLGDGSVIMILDPNGLAKSSGNIISTKDTLSSRDQTDIAHAVNMSSFVIFRAGPGAPKAVPLELVSRLEEIDVAHIEESDQKKVIQYRDSLMYLTQLDPNYQIPKQGIQQIIVFTDHKKIMGLMVEEILDIVEHPIAIELSHSTHGFLSPLVINNKTIDLIDLSYFFHHMFGSEDEKKSISTTHKKPAHILFIDDSPFFRKFIPPALATEGYEVTTASSAKNALELLAQGMQFEAIITDINMPDMNGTEFVQECKNDSRFSSIPIIALSSNINEQIIKNPTAIGLSAFVSKTNHDDLLSVISHVLA